MTDPVQDSQPTLESVPAAGAVTSSANKQVVDESNKLPTVEPKVEDKIDDNWVWNGNVEELPKPLLERGKGMLRTMHKATQETAQLRKEQAELKAHLESEEYQEYLRNKQSQPLLTEEEWSEALSDPTRLPDVVNKIVEAKLNEAAKTILPTMQQLQQKNALSEAKEEILNFAEVHPDFLEADPTIIKSVVDEIVVKGNGTLEDAYKRIKDIEKFYSEKINKSIQDKVASKRNSITLPPTPTSSIEVVYVDKDSEINKAAFEHAKLGKHVEVRLNRKK